jgi:hypothetical protein
MFAAHFMIQWGFKIHLLRRGIQALLGKRADSHQKVMIYGSPYDSPRQ